MRHTLSITLVLIALAVASSPQTGQAVIAFKDSPTVVTYTTGTAINYPSFAVSAGADVMVVMVGTRGGSSSAATPTSMLWNGKTLIRAVTKNNVSSTWREIAIYYLFSPGTGTANITGTAASSITGSWVQAYTLSGVNVGVAPLVGSVNASGGSSIALTVPAVLAGTWAALGGIAGPGTTVGITASSGTVSVGNNTTGDGTLAMGGVSSVTGGSTLTFTTADTSKKAFVAAYFSPLTEGCATPAPTGSASQFFCSTASPTVANLVATGTAIKWYDAPSGGNLLTSGTPLNTAHYYASQTVDCESTERLDVTVTVSTVVPGVPTGVTATTPTLNQVHLAWTAPGGPVTAYKIYRGTSSGTETFLASPAGTGTTYDNTGLAAGTHYYYKVSAVNGGCESGLSDSEGDAIVHGNFYSGASGNWSDLNTWALSSGGSTGYGPPIAGDGVIITSAKTVTVDGSASCAALKIGESSTISYLNFSGTAPTTLNVSGRLDVSSPAGSDDTRAGVLTFTSDATVTAGQCYLNRQLKSGVKSTIDMTAGGKLVAGLLGAAGSSAPANAGSTIWTPGAGTVELNANNTLPATVWTNFNNLTISAGTTILAANLAIGGKLEIGASAAMDLGTYASTANSLWIDGVLQPAGEWGSVGSGAANSSARFTGSGRMIVATGNGCTPPAAPTGSASQTFCSAASPTVASLAATGTAIQWYADSSGGSPLSGGTALVNGTHYYASQTIVCESTSRFDVTATVNTSPTAPNSDAGNKTGQTLDLSIAKLLSRATGTGLSVTAVQDPSTSGGHVVLNSGAGTISYTAPATPGVDSFTYTISGLNGCTASPTIYVTNVVDSGGSPNVVSGPTYANGKFSVTFAGVPGVEYTVQYTTATPPNSGWTFLKNVAADSQGKIVVEDTVGGDPWRAYRTVWPVTP